MNRIFTWATRASVPATVLFCTVMLGWLQYQFHGLYDADSYFHTRAASELDRNGLQREFPQAAFSTWKERYSDKDFLFHVLLVSFQRLNGVETSGIAESRELVAAGKQAVVFCSFVLFASMALSLRLVRARFAPFWILLLFSWSPFLMHIMSVRPHLLGYALVILEVALIQRRSVWCLAVLGAIHTWTHSSFFLLPILGVAATSASFLRDEPLPLRTLMASILGPLVTFVAHPYFPNNIWIAWEQLFGVARSVWGLRTDIPQDLFGPELTAASTAMFLSSVTAWGPAALGVAGFLVARPPRSLSTGGLSLGLMTAALLLMSMLSQRFLGFWFPVAILLGARLWSELAGSVPLGETWRDARKGSTLSVAALALCLVFGQIEGNIGKVRAGILNVPDDGKDQKTAIAYLSRHAAPDELVYHNFWESFSVLYHYRPEGRYVEALDPVFFYNHDPKLFRKAVRAYRGRLDDLHDVLANDFGATWVFVPRRLDYRPFLELLQADRRFVLAYEDMYAQIFHLTD